MRLLTNALIYLTLVTTTLAQEPDTADKDYSSELPRIKPLSPADSQQQFVVKDGFAIQLVASEPLVVDPVAFAFDSKGQLWVVEMRDYSEQDQERLGRVAVLRDTNGDGIMDQRSTFVEGLSWPTAIWPWMDGVLVADAPNLTFHRDLDGDLIADRSENWYSGFGRSNVQGLINSFRWGVDGWIHGATSSSGAELSTTDGTKIPLGRRDFSIDPLSKQLRAESGGGQHGMDFNRWGDKFVTSNSDHLQQIVDIENWLATQHSQVAIPSVRRSIAEDGPQAEVFRASPIEPWRIVRTRLRMSGVAPGIVEGGGRAAGYFTGATGTCILDTERGFGLPSEMYDSAIVCDVGSNLVHRKRLVPNGLFFTGQRIDKQSELLSSRDIWFRPVQIGPGPDGALYIADMYREVIEHPASLPPMIKKHLDLTSGRDKGRIWRMYPKSQPPEPIPNIYSQENAQAIELLAAEIACQRLIAAQLLLERFQLGQLNEPAMARIQHIALTAARPEARILALHLLARTEKFDTPLARRALKDRHPRVLSHLLDLCANAGLADELHDQVGELIQPAEDQQLLLALAKFASALKEDAKLVHLQKLLLKTGEPLVQAAIATAAGADSWRLIQSATQQQMSNEVYQQWLILWLPAWSEQFGSNAELAKFVGQSLRSDNQRQTAWLGALSRLGSAGQTTKFRSQSGIQESIDAIIDARLQHSPTVEVVRWLRLASTETQAAWLSKLLHRSVAEELQAACIESLDWANHPALTDSLIDNFVSMTPPLQTSALRAIVSRQERLPKLVSGLTSQRVARSQIPAEMRQALFTAKDKLVAEQFKEILNQASTDRAAVLNRFQSVLELTSFDTTAAQHGKEVFQRVCAQCHRIGDIGNDVGPPLKQLGDKSPQQLLESILDPSREVDPKYMGYTILLDDGVVINGIILQESGQQITVAEAGGKQRTLDRAAIEEMKSSGLSLMPNGLEEQITVEQMAQLIQFLKAPQ